MLMFFAKKLLFGKIWLRKINSDRAITTTQKMKFSIKDIFSKCDQIRSPADLVTFTEKILNGKLHFLCSVLFLRQILPQANDKKSSLSF